MQFDSIPQLLEHGGFTVYILILCSIVSLKIAIDKYIQFSGLQEKTLDKIQKETFENLKAGGLNDALEYLSSIKLKKFGFRVPAPLASVYQTILLNKDLPLEELSETAYNKLDRELVDYEKGLGIHATLGSITPFIGLFGTVIGIIKSFHALSLQDSTNYSRVISGIAEALVATAAGLFVAIPSVMFFNYFTKKLKRTMPVLDGNIRELITALKVKRG
jgi:biopolymer transport protein ExbB/TolQ